VAIGAIIGFVWFEWTIPPIPTLGDLLTGPYKAIPSNLKLPGTEGKLLQNSPFEGFMVRLQVGIAVGAVLFSPMWLYQLWAFITPGLYAKEKKFARIFVTCAVVLFVGGAVLAYLVVPEALTVLSQISANEFVTALTADKYISFILSLLVIFGVSFELPLLVVMLNRVGVVKYAQLKKWRRGIVFALFVFAAFATPGSDPFSMLGLAGALTVLFEIAIQLARWHDRKKDRERVDEGWDKLADDEAAPFDYTPSTIDDEPSTPTASGGRSSTDDIT